MTRGLKNNRSKKDRQAELRRQQNEAKIKQAATAKELGLKGKSIITFRKPLIVTDFKLVFV